MQERSEETRARILAAAVKHFSHSGYEATSVAAICASAGVSKGAFYHHFPSKQSVFLRLLDNWLAGLDQQINQFYHSAGDIPDGLLQMASLTGGIFREASGQLPMFLEFWTQAARDPLIWQATIAPYQHYQLLFTGIIQQGITQGDLKPVEPDVTARIIVAMAVGILLQSLIDPHGAAWDQVTLQGIHMLLDGIPEGSMILNLVTGASGHIGNVLVRELLECGQRVRALVLPGEDMGSLGGLEVEFVEGNVLDITSLNNAMCGVDIVYHLAGMISIMPGRDEMLRAVNILGTRNVLCAACSSGIRRLVYTSSIHAIQHAPAGVTIDESAPFDPCGAISEYDRSKAEASLEVLKAARGGLDAVIVCPTGVIGPLDYRSSMTGSAILSWMRRGLHIFVDGAYDFVDVRDVARGHILAAEKGRSGEAYILSGERLSLETIDQYVQEITHVHSPHLKIPFGLAAFFARFTPYYYRWTHQVPRFTPYMLVTVASNSFISSAKAQRELGYAPRSLKQSIADTVEWLRGRL